VDDDLVAGEVDVLDPELEAFHEPETGSVEEPGDEESVVAELGEDGSDLVAAQDDGKARGLLGPDELPELADLPAKDGSVEEEDGGEGLVLG
jgi:hypothetical protein